MLLELARWLADSHFRAFSVFEYITFRAVLAAATALIIGLFSGPWVIRKLTALQNDDARAPCGIFAAPRHIFF